MLDPTTVRNDRLRDTGRWGYTGEIREDPMPIEDSGSFGRWILWAGLIALVVVALVLLTGSVI